AIACKKYEVSVCPSNCEFNSPNENYSIGLAVSFNEKAMTRQALSLYWKNIKFLNDLLVYQSSCKLTWQEFNTHFDPIPKGSTPS
ncbi:11750_t:CDS:1, partial [Acaulospora morrowiae]